jgi:hypothetical protein
MGHNMMGHNDRERRRLAPQASILQPVYGASLSLCGDGGGMHVLDIGCGVRRREAVELQVGCPAPTMVGAFAREA